jgi:hypothetical protein
VRNLRWQIELAFKRLKSLLLDMGDLPPPLDPQPLPFETT